MGNGLVMWAERTVPSGIAALIVATVSVWFVLLDGLRPGGQPWTARVWVGTVIGLAGVALVARPSGGVAGGHWWAIVGPAGRVPRLDVGSLYAQSVPKRLPLATAAAIEMLVAGLLLLVASLLFGEDLSLLAGASPRAWAGVVYLGVFGSLVGFTAFAYCLNELPASTVSTYAYVNPVVAVALGALILGRAPHRRAPDRRRAHPRRGDPDHAPPAKDEALAFLTEVACVSSAHSAAGARRAPRRVPSAR